MKTFLNNKTIKRIIIARLILGLVCNNIAFAETPTSSAHSAKTDKTLNTSALSLGTLKYSFQPVHDDKIPKDENVQNTTAIKEIFIPESYGKIENLPIAADQESNKTVILIKDAHCNYEAQTNISRILEILISDYNIDLVCVEGASGKIDTSSVASHSDNSETRKKVTDKYLRNGLLTASEALSINRGAEPGFSIWGVENLKLYFKDYQAFRRTVGTNGETKYFVDLLSETIIKLKKKLYPERLQRFDAEINRYEINEIPLTNFIKFLALTKPISQEEYKTLGLVLVSIRLEEKIYFGKVETERTQLIKHLEKQLTKDDLRELIKQSLLFKLGKISQVDYYMYLEGFYRAYRETITFPVDNLTKYFQLVRLQAKINEKELFVELEKFQKSIYNDLIPDKTAYKLYKLDKDIKILGKILHLESTREDFLYYKTNRRKFRPEKLISLLKVQAPINKIYLPLEFLDPIFLKKIDTAFLPSEEFYKLALNRDNALVENLLKTMELHKKNSAVLVVGGFHTDGITKILSKKGISPIIITPSITKPQGNSKELYLARIMDERINPEMILAKLGLENLQTLLLLSNLGLTEYTEDIEGLIRALEEADLAGEIDSLRELTEKTDLDDFLLRLWKRISQEPEKYVSVRALVEKLAERRGLKLSSEQAVDRAEAPATAEEPGDRSITSILIPEEYRAVTMERDGEPKDVETLKKEVTTARSPLKDRVQARIDLDLVNEIEFRRQRLDVLNRALEEALSTKYLGADISNLAVKDNTLYLTLVDKSPHPVGNHIKDSYIYVNRYIIDRYHRIEEMFNRETADNFLQWFLEHDLLHECCPNEIQDEEFERKLTKRDAIRFIELFGNNATLILKLLLPSGQFKKELNNLLTPELVEEDNILDYGNIALTSFGVFNRKKYEEDLVFAVEDTDTESVQAAHLKIQNFKGEFNTRGEDWGIGHVLGDLALQVIGPLLQNFLNEALLDYPQASGIVYNEGPSYYIILKNIEDPSSTKKIIENLLRHDSKFKQAVIEEIKKRLFGVIGAEKYAGLTDKLKDFTPSNFNMYCGVSELVTDSKQKLIDHLTEELRRHKRQTEGTEDVTEKEITEIETRVGEMDPLVITTKLADVLDLQAIEIAKFAQLTIDGKDGEIARQYRAILKLAAQRERVKRAVIDSKFSDLLVKARDVAASKVEQFDADKKEDVELSKQYILSREYTSFHMPIGQSFNPHETYAALFMEYRMALEAGDFKKIESIKQRIARKTTEYKTANLEGTPIYYGNERFKDTINYIVKTKPKVNLKLTFRIGGDEYGVLIWGAQTGKLRILRCDGNNIGATTFQWGREIGDKVIDEQLRIIHETEDVNDISQKMLEFFNDMGDRGLVITEELYNTLREQLISFYAEWGTLLGEEWPDEWKGEFDETDYFETKDGQHILKRIPPVIVSFPVTDENLAKILASYDKKGKKHPKVVTREILKNGEKVKQKYILFLSQAITSIGETVIHTNLIDKDDLDKDYSSLQGEADAAGDLSKSFLKNYQAENHGLIDTALTYKQAIIPGMAVQLITKAYAMSRAQTEIAGYIVESEETRATAKEISKDIKESGILGVDEGEIIDAITEGRIGRERIDFMKILNLARKNKGLAPPQLFALALKIGDHVDKLLDEEAKQKGDEVLESILKKIVEVPQGESAKDVFMAKLKEALADLGVTTEEIESDLQLIELGLFVITFDPLLDKTEIDKSYFDFIALVAELAGFSRETVIGAFAQGYFTKQIELLTEDLREDIREEIRQGILTDKLELNDAAKALLFRKIPAYKYEQIEAIAKKNRTAIEESLRVERKDSHLAKAVQRLTEYRKDTSGNYDLSRTDRTLWDLDFTEGEDDLDKFIAKLKNPSKNDRNNYLSSMHAVSNDVEAIINALSNTPAADITKLREPVGVICHINEYIEYNREDGTFSFKPGLETVFRQMEEGINIAFTTEDIPEDEVEHYRKALKATGRFGDTVFLEKNVIEASTKLASQGIDTENERIVYITKDKRKAGLITGIKRVVITEDTAFHATLLFSVLFARAGKVIIGAELNPRVKTFITEFLKAMGYEPQQIAAVLDDLKSDGFFTVRLIHIKEILDDFQNRRMFIETAA